MGSPNDIWNHPVQFDAVDPNSAAHITASSGVANPTFYASTKLEYINPTTSAKLIGVETNGGHPLGDLPTQFPYTSSFYFENSPSPTQTAGSGDSHLLAIATDTCTGYEGYSSIYDSGTNKVGLYTGNSYNLQAADAGGGLAFFPAPFPGLNSSYVTAGGLDLIPGMVKYEEAVAHSIKHALIMALTIHSINSTAYRYPGGPQVASTFTGTGTPLSYASHMRLHSSYTDGTATAECQAVLTALKDYGAYVNDQQSAGVQNPIYMADGLTDPLGTGYSSLNFNCLNNLHITDFDELTPVVRP